MTTGLVVVFTGNGKGKTTSAVGMGLRASGHDKRVLLVQFVKGRWRSGEIVALEAIPRFEVVRHGAGFTWNNAGSDGARHKTAAAEALRIARSAVTAGQHDMIILDEICVAASLGLIAEEAVLDLVASKPAAMHLVLTGRGAGQKLIDRADLVTVMQEEKHPYRSGTKAQEGIEF